MSSHFADTSYTGRSWPAQCETIRLALSYHTGHLAVWGDGLRGQSRRNGRRLCYCFRHRAARFQTSDGDRRSLAECCCFKNRVPYLTPAISSLAISTPPSSSLRRGFHQTTTTRMLSLTLTADLAGSVKASLYASTACADTLTG